MAPLVLYYFPPSGPCRMALSAIRCLGLDVEIHEINLYQKEQLKEDFIKINPQHTVPTLDDNGFILTESRAIVIYLAEKYFPDGHSLYPKDIQQRALINARLQFDCGTLYPRIRAIQWKFVYLGDPTISEDNRKDLHSALALLNKFLDGNKYVTGSEEPTLADTTIFVSITNVVVPSNSHTFVRLKSVSLGGDLSKYPNIDAWYERCKTLPCATDSLIVAGVKIFTDKARSVFTGTL